MKPSKVFRYTIELLLIVFLVSAVISAASRMMTASSDMEVLCGYLLIALLIAGSFAGLWAIYLHWRKSHEA